MRPVLVRFAEAEDVPAVLELERGIEESPHWAAADYWGIVQARTAASVRRCLMVAKTGEALEGFAVGKTAEIGTEVNGELESVAVAMSARRGGVGRALCMAVVDWCSKQGARTVELEVRADSGGAIALYAGLGFVEVGRRRRYYRAPDDDAVLMRL